MFHRTQNGGKHCRLAEPAVKRIYHPAMAAVLDVVYNSNVETLAEDLGAPCATDRQARLEKSSAPVQATEMSHPPLSAARRVQSPLNSQKPRAENGIRLYWLCRLLANVQVLHDGNVFLYAPAWCHCALIPKRATRDSPQFFDKSMQFRYR